MASRNPVRQPAGGRPASSRKSVATKTTTGKSAARKVADAAPQPNMVEGAKPAKTKLIRDSFTIPKNEYAVIDTLKKRASKTGLPSKKSELLRAGLMALTAMDAPSFEAAVSAVPRLKTGRPKTA